MSSSFADRPPRRTRGVALLSIGLALLAGAAALPGPARAADGPRVIEMVSPPDTAGQSAAPGAALGITEPPLLGDGTFIGYNLLTPLFPDQGNGWGTLWQASRTSAGWTRGQLDPPAAQQGGDEMYTVQATTPDGSRTIVKSEQYQSLFLPGPPEQHVAPSRLTLREADGRSRRIVELPFPAGEQAPTSLATAGSSRDLETVLFNTTARLLDDQHVGFGSQSYLWRDGTLTVAGVDAAGTPLRCGAPAAGDVLHAPVSEDGSVAYVVYGIYDAGNGLCGTPAHIAANIGGRTWPVNDPAPGLPDLFNNTSFAGSSPDGLTAWYVTPDRITTDDSNTNADLYRSDLPAGGGPATVRCVTCSVPDAQVGRADITRDRRHVVFSAANAVGGLGVDGAPGGNLFALSDDGTLELITSAALAPEYRVTPDARFVLATSTDQLTTYDNRGLAEVYRFARRAGGGYDVTCVSCDPSGAPPVSGAPQRVPAGLFGLDNRSISDDGRTIAFVSADALLPAAVAGVLNLYEWHDGRLSLLYTGLSNTDPRLFGVSPSGDDVYFDAYGFVTTESRQSTDAIYDARRGGGFPAAPTPAAPCVASACQGAPSAPPALPVAATVRLTGEPVASGPPAAPRRSTRVAKKAVRGSTVRIDVVAPAKGRITVSGAHVRSGARSVTRAGTYGVAVTLTAKAKRTLKRKGRLAVRLKVAFRPSAGAVSTATTTVTVKR